MQPALNMDGISRWQAVGLWILRLHSDRFSLSEPKVRQAARMIARSRVMMVGHPMFQGEQVRLMTLCPDCRQRAMAGVPA